ncbi:MAG: Maf family protein [Ilumatobacteraceae bacterium]
MADTQSRRLVLASASPRRSDLLTSAGLRFEVVPADIDETPHPGELPIDYVARLSKEKAAAVTVSAADAVVIAADTTVAVDAAILEKPTDSDDARRMLGLLSARTHLVHTGVTVAQPAVETGGVTGIETIVATTAVTFAELSDADIDWYVGTGDWQGKAGGYGIQGAAGVFVTNVDGSVTNVIGLPLAETVALLRQR